MLDFLHDLIEVIRDLYLNGNPLELGKRSYKECTQRIRSRTETVLRKLAEHSE